MEKNGVAFREESNISPWAPGQKAIAHGFVYFSLATLAIPWNFQNRLYDTTSCGLYSAIGKGESQFIGPEWFLRNLKVMKNLPFSTSFF